MAGWTKSIASVGTVIAPIAGFGYLVLAHVAVAGDAPKPGLWKITTRFQIGEASTRERSRTECITQAMIDNLAKGFAPSVCKSTTRRVALSLIAQLECPAPADNNKINLELTINFDTPQHYSGTMHAISSSAGRTTDRTFTLQSIQVRQLWQLKNHMEV